MGTNTLLAELKNAETCAGAAAILAQFGTDPQRDTLAELIDAAERHLVLARAALANVEGGAA